MTEKRDYFICGIGGSGMLPLAVILKGMGHDVSGSDRSFDQGRTPEKFEWLKGQGIRLHPQDGSGVSPSLTAVVISKAVEDTVPDIAAAKANNVPILKRADMLIDLFNRAGLRIAVSGTSGKTTTTGMIGFLLREAGLDPTIMNGGIFLNYAKDNPFSTAFVGNGHMFVSEIDESDGIEAVVRYRPDIAVIHNISLDHQPMEELKRMFSGFLAQSGTAVINADDPVTQTLAAGFGGKMMTYGFAADADLNADDLRPHAGGIKARLRGFGEEVELSLAIPGRHNISNALAAISVAKAAGLTLRQSAEILSRFTGIRRRMELIGAKNGISVIDDFAHNPDKVAATLTTLKEFQGRLQIFFQPHGFGFLKMVGPELAEAFAAHLGREDLLYLVEPFYAGGTVDRAVGAADIVAPIIANDRQAFLMNGREEVGTAIIGNARLGDRIVIMGARDDSLSEFARDILAHLP